MGQWEGHKARLPILTLHPRLGGQPRLAESGLAICEQINSVSLTGCADEAPSFTKHLAHSRRS